MAQNGKTTRRRRKGDGTVYKSGDRWRGAVQTGRTKPDGAPEMKYFSGKTQAEVKKLISEYMASKSPIQQSGTTMQEYIDRWLSIFKRPALKPSSYDRLEITAHQHVVPNIGYIALESLTADDVQLMLNNLKEDGLSHSSVRKAYDCVNAVCKHAVTKGDIVKNPVDAVSPPNKKTFSPQKDIVFFTQEEARRISEEAVARYSTGAPRYIYGDVFRLILNTGLREGEAVALYKSDWDREKNVLHIQRNAQYVKQRDAKANTNYKVEIQESTKTYSGDRRISLNKNAVDALENLCLAHPDSKLIVCNSKGEIVTPVKLNRTFHRLLERCGLPQTGVHSLRHTFASFLFDRKVDIKTISKILGHSSVQVTTNIYVHLFDETGSDAVATLDDYI